ncbi:MAG: hypothetical protein COA36_16820 [Desulfotalea sp.]|nr:MAG: hypothetical protein COA36_16820 [Desulfotalea sp.]
MSVDLPVIIDNITNSIDRCSEPLTDAQKMAFAGALSCTIGGIEEMGLQGYIDMLKKLNQ